MRTLFGLLIALFPSGCAFAIDPLDGDSFAGPSADVEARHDGLSPALDGALSHEAGAAPSDLAVSGPRDLTSMAPPDLAQPPPDLTPPGHRLAFLLPAGKGNLGGIFGLDARCTTEANIHFHFGIFAAVIAFPGLSARDHVKLSGNRDIVLPDGTAVATDATFFSAQHLAAIDQFADGTTPAMGDGACVWTNTNDDGSRATTDDCKGWTKSGKGEQGNVSDPFAANADWGDPVNQAGCDTDCFLYCIQQ